MSFGLDALFEERLEAFPAEPASVSHTPGSAKAVIRALIKERDEAQAQVKEHATTIEHLENRIYKKVEADQELSVDVVRRLHRLETDVQNLRKENARLHDNLKAAESETATLRDTISEKAQKVKGALKKSKNAKEVAGKEEQKAKDAVNERTQLLKSQKEMRKERNDALANLAEQQKIAEDLRAELKLEQSGHPHLRDTEGSRSNCTTLVVPLEFKIKRADHMKTLPRLWYRQKYFLHTALIWHQAWATREEEDAEEEDGYATGSEEDEEEDKLCRGMVEGGVMTGAEHDGWRSMKGIEAVCRKAEGRYGS
jgi:chromosome segregation ATPase